VVRWWGLLTARARVHGHCQEVSMFSWPALKETATTDISTEAGRDDRSVIKVNMSAISELEPSKL
jgi:hypothetical protein